MAASSCLEKESFGSRMKMGCLVTSLADLSLPISIEIGIGTMMWCFRAKRKWRRFGNYRTRYRSRCMIFNCPRVISLHIDNHRVILIIMKQC